MARYDITTVASLWCAVKAAKEIYILPKFGTSELWIKITKAEAKKLISGLDVDETPMYYEMFADTFGTMTNGGTLYLG